MASQSTQQPTDESLRAAMAHAWQDHHHARDQTWRALQMEAVLGAGLVTVDAQFQNVVATASAGVLLVIAAISGLLISWHHRRLERRKFIHILNCEELLHLHQDSVIPPEAEDPKQDPRPETVKDGAVSVPRELKLLDVINPCAQNTALFILRMHLAVMAFGILMIVLRTWAGSR